MKLFVLSLLAFSAAEAYANSCFWRGQQFHNNQDTGIWISANSCNSDRIICRNGRMMSATHSGYDYTPYERAISRALPIRCGGTGDPSRNEPSQCNADRPDQPYPTPGSCFFKGRRFYNEENTGYWWSSLTCRTDLIVCKNGRMMSGTVSGYDYSPYETYVSKTKPSTCQ